MATQNSSKRIEKTIYMDQSESEDEDKGNYINYSDDDNDNDNDNNDNNNGNGGNGDCDRSEYGELDSSSIYSALEESVEPDAGQKHNFKCGLCKLTFHLDKHQRVIKCCHCGYRIVFKLSTTNHITIKTN